MDISNQNELLELLRQGKIEALDVIYKAYYKPLVATAYTILKDHNEAQEAVNDCFVDFWEKKLYKNVSYRLDSYLYVIVRRKCSHRIEKMIRTRGERKEYIKLQQEHEDTSGHGMEEVRCIEVSVETALKCLDALPNMQRQTVKLAKMQEMSLKQIAAAQNVSINTVKTNLRKGIENLRRYFNNAYSN